MSNELPAGRELDNAVACAMGYTVRRGPGIDYDGLQLSWEVWDKDGETHNPVRWSAPKSDTDRAAVLEALQWYLLNNGHVFYHPGRQGWHAARGTLAGHENTFVAGASPEAFALVVSRAIVKAVL